mmetsp:Transcript_28113/g.76271  ORF Transcript_28113/g.76271 Transcript_28113/m.76271 type:complete len:276 (-) Transcript_28113:225-1052(-)
MVDGDIALSLVRFIDFVLPFFLLVAFFLYVLVFFIIYFVIIVVTNIRNVFRSSSATRSPCAAAAEKGQDGAHDDSGLGSRRHRSPSVLVGGRDVGVPIQRTVSQQGTAFRLIGSDFNGGNALPTRCEPHRNVVVVKRKRVWEIERVIPVPIGALLSLVRIIIVLNPVAAEIHWEKFKEVVLYAQQLQIGRCICSVVECVLVQIVIKQYSFHIYVAAKRASCVCSIVACHLDLGERDVCRKLFVAFNSVKFDIQGIRECNTRGCEQQRRSRDERRK